MKNARKWVFSGFALALSTSFGACAGNTRSDGPDGDAALGGAGGEGGGSEDGGSTGGSSVGPGGAPSVTPGTGTLGESCGNPGDLGCAGVRQKLKLLCGADGKWESAGTCDGAGQVCATDGDERGTCVEPLEPCAETEAEDVYCDGAKIRACGVDGRGGEVAETCPDTCKDGECAYSEEPCGEPEGAAIFYNCDSKCGVTSGNCTGCSSSYGWGLVGDSFRAIRIPSQDGYCTGDLARTCGERPAYVVSFDEGFARTRATVGPGYGLYVSETTPTVSECESGMVQGCAILEKSENGGRVYLIPLDPDVPARNVTFEPIGDDEGCP